jgi:two-component system, NarL family, response regulator DevR
MTVDEIRVYVVDDHPVVVAGIAQLLSRLPGIEVVGTASSGEVALRDIEFAAPNVLVVDHRLGSGMTGIELCQAVTAPPLSIRCLALTANADPDAIRGFIDAGALGFLLKKSEPGAIETAVRSVARGERFVDQSVAHVLIHRIVEGTAAGVGALTPREKQVLGFVAAGLSNRQIADELCVSTSSVKGYVASLLRKLGVGHRAEAVAVAARSGGLKHPADES